jgi:UDP-GlcNAc:undecaprenyl-phosphate/decaprenyl-phosphate GlcNAc-1-phosphate transferase
LTNSWLAFVVALVASFGLTGPIRQLALRIDMVDSPGPRKVHLKPKPLLGGIAIFFGFALGIAITMHNGARAETFGILAGATLLVVAGILDDAGKLHHQIKLFAAMPLAACFLLAFGIRAQVFSVFLPGKVGANLDIGLTLLWVVGVTAAFSILDHMDGLCAGIAAIAATFFVIVAGKNGQFLVLTLAAASLGAALGFLFWNFAPAKIFMGDAGAMLLGFLMATLGLKIRPDMTSSSANWLPAVLILGVPIFDTTLIVISRARRGLLPFSSPGKDHTAHRLSNLGFGQKRAVLLLYGLGGVCGLLGLLVAYLPSRGLYAVCGLILLTVIVGIFILERSPFERQPGPEKSPPLPADEIAIRH